MKMAMVLSPTILHLDLSATLGAQFDTRTLAFVQLG